MQEPPQRVLLAYSSSVTQAAIRFLLQQLGYSVAVVDYGAELRSLTDQSQFDAMFVDVKMIGNQCADFLGRLSARLQHRLTLGYELT